MSNLVVYRGVPGSGKSTSAIESAKLFPTLIVRVNRDDIRFTLFGKYWGPGVDEEIVTDVENAMVESGLRAGKTVLLDATNLNGKFLKTKLSLASRYGAGVEFLDFPVSLATALERNASRDRKVPEKAIRDMFKRYRIDINSGVLPKVPAVLPDFDWYVPDTTRRTAYIVDTDGTTANHEPHRSPYDHTKYHLDTPHNHVVQIVRALIEQGEHAVIALSGRDAKYRQVTEQWWIDNGLDFHEFHFRPEGDTRMDAIVKYELFMGEIAPRYNVLGAFDDRPQVIRMWETIGVPVFMVGDRKEF